MRRRLSKPETVDDGVPDRRCVEITVSDASAEPSSRRARAVLYLLEQRASLAGGVAFHESAPVRWAADTPNSSPSCSRTPSGGVTQGSHNPTVWTSVSHRSASLSQRDAGKPSQLSERPRRATMPGGEPHRRHTSTFGQYRAPRRAGRWHTASRSTRCLCRWPLPAPF
jgi:hypothetical protein